MLVELYVTLAHTLGIGVGYLGKHLPGLVHETVVDEPLAHKLLRELALGLAGLQILLITVGVEVAAAVGGVYLVYQVYLAVTKTKLVFRVYQYQTAAGGYLLTAGKKGTSVALHRLIVLSAHNALGDNLFFRDVQVVTLVGFRRRGDDGLGETLVLFHALGQTDTAQLAAAFLVGAPGRTGQDRADNHLHPETLALQTYRHHGVGAGKLPVGADVARVVQKLRGYLVQYLAFEGNALGKHYIEGGDTVGGHHHNQVVADIVNVSYFAVVYTGLSGKMKISLR